MSNEKKSVTCTAPVNIAVIKYWGKRDRERVLPTNSSISVTLHQEQLRTKTTVVASKQFSEDRMWLNGKEQSVGNNRVQSVLRGIRRRARKRHLEQSDEKNVSIVDFLNWKLHICTENNFPTAAGLASSAAGYACLAFSLAKLYDVEGPISDIARLGSGSACRSVEGGFVLWDKGTSNDGTDSIAHQILDECSWPELRILILVVADQKKDTGSSDGMQRSVETSQLYAKRLEDNPNLVVKMKDAIMARDFNAFSEMTMRDSNQLHAICLDTYPPLFYLNDTSKQIIQLVHHYNELHEDTKVAYTFDAGPNACLFVLEDELGKFVSTLNYFFPRNDNSSVTYIQGQQIDSHNGTSEHIIQNIPMQVQKGALKYIISTKPGPGPHVLEEDASLLDEDGRPKDTNKHT